MNGFLSEILSNPMTWVTLSTLAFVGLIIHFKVPRMATDALDARAETIAKELDEAAKLREEAQALLASYQRRQRQAEKEVEEIIALAKAESVRMRSETEKALAEHIERRTAMAEDKIAQAEAQALQDVSIYAADTAVNATRKLLTDRIDDTQGAALIDKNIDEITSKLH